MPNIYHNANTFWTEQEDQQLTAMAKQGETLTNLAQFFGRSPIAIILHLRQLSGLEIPYPKDLLPAEFNDPNLTIRQQHTDHCMPWSDMDNQCLQTEFYQGHTVLQLARDLNRTPRAIILQILNLNSTPSQMNALYQRAKFLIGKTKLPASNHITQSSETTSADKTFMDESEPIIEQSPIDTSTPFTQDLLLADPSTLTDEQISHILTLIPAIEKWIKHVKEYTINEVQQTGAIYPGFRLKEFRRRKIADMESASAAIRNFNESLFQQCQRPQELRTITQLEKIMGKFLFDQILSDYITTETSYSLVGE